MHRLATLTAVAVDVRCGDIGPVRREITFEPLPETPAVPEPAPAPPPSPERLPAEPVQSVPVQSVTVP